MGAGKSAARMSWTRHFNNRSGDPTETLHLQHAAEYLLGVDS
jgi:hypothetical protein